MSLILHELIGQVKDLTGHDILQRFRLPLSQVSSILKMAEFHPPVVDGIYLTKEIYIKLITN